MTNGTDRLGPDLEGVAHDAIDLMQALLTSGDVADGAEAFLQFRAERGHGCGCQYAMATLAAMYSVDEEAGAALDHEAATFLNEHYPAIVHGLLVLGAGLQRAVVKAGGVEQFLATIQDGR